MDNEIEQLKRQVSELLKWKAERLKQQITFPLDPKSIEIINKYFLMKIGNLDFTNSTGQVFRNIMIQQDGKTDVVSARTSISRFTANATSNKIFVGEDIVNNTQGRFFDNDQVWVLSTDSLPAPLSDAVPYYVINESNNGTEFQLSLTSGGSAINLTNIGSGNKFIELFT